METRIETILAEASEVSEVVQAYGADLIGGLLTVVGGIVIIKVLIRGLRRMLVRYHLKESTVSMTCNAASAILMMLLVAIALVRLGFDPKVVCSLSVAVALVVVAFILLLGPYIPSLPFKVGQTVKAGSLLGKVEATNLINTRMRTFDGKTFFVPNGRIISDIVQNYHYTPSRRVKLDFAISYQADLLKAKQLLEEVMIEDPRVLPKPSPVVYVLNIDAGCLQIGGRCWVDNPNYWTARCDLLEKTALRMRSNGIELIPPQVGIQQSMDRPPVAAA